MRNKGFTLIELLIVISVLGVLSVGVVTALNVTSTIDKAKLAKAKTFAASVENSLSISQVGKWNFNDSSLPGKDISGYGNNGALNGGTVWTAAAACGLELEGCLSFDGVDDWLSIPDSSNLRLNDMTISLWYYIDTPTGGAGSNRELLAKGEYWWNAVTNDNDLWALYNINDNPDKFLFVTRISSNLHQTISVDTGLTGWVHIAATKKGTAGKIYINGDEKASGALDPTTNAASSALTISGDGSNGRIIKGKVDDVQLYNQSLIASDIQRLYARGLIKHLLSYAE